MIFEFCGERLFGKTVVSFQLPQAIITGYFKDPGTDCGILSEFRQLLPDDDKGVLGYVLGPSGVIDIAHTQAKYFIPKRFIYFCEIHLLAGPMSAVAVWMLLRFGCCCYFFRK